MEFAVRLLKTENRKIKVEDLIVCDAYQRTVARSKVKRMVKGFDHDAYGSLTVGQRRDGSCWCVDGLHRLEVAKKMGVEMVSCDVFASEGPEHEARVFRLKNRERTNVSALALFRAQLTEGDEQSRRIMEIVQAAGLKLALKEEGKGWPYIKAITAMQRSYARVGDEGVSTVLRLLTEIWAGEGDALQGDMIEGMSVFLKKNPDVDQKRLVEKLRTKPVSSVIRAADSKYQLERDCMNSSTSGRAAATCYAIALVYNKGLRLRRATG